jgi:hypothetical protein
VGSRSKFENWCERTKWGNDDMNCPAERPSAPAQAHKLSMRSEQNPSVG